MRLRTALSVANLAAIVVAFLVLFEFPQYAYFAFYALMGWIFVGFALLYLPGVGRPVATSPPSPAGSAASPERAEPLPSLGAPREPVALDFCIWCGSSLPPGSSSCASCGRRVASI